MRQGGEVLEALVRSLSSSGCYKVISHPESWTMDTLESLHAASEEAVKRGVKVVRVFNLLGDFSHVDSVRLRKKLIDQKRLMMENDNYEVRLLWDKALKGPNWDGELQRFASGRQRAFFQKNEEGPFLLVEINNPDLSEMGFFMGKHRYGEQLERFSKILDKAVPLVPSGDDIIDKCIRDCIER